MRHFFPVLLLLIFFSNLNSAPLVSFSFNDSTKMQCEQWQVIDVTFHASSSMPFYEQFGAEITSPVGITKTIHGFYNGDNNWLLRFSAPDTGIWTFKTFSSLNELAGKSGDIYVLQNTNPDRHGGIIIDPDNRSKFIYKDGTPYFTMAFEWDWLFAMDYGDSALPKAQQLLEHVKNNGFNQVVMNVFAYDVNWPKDPDLKPEHDYGSPVCFPFGGSNDEPDFTTLNPYFFQHLDSIMVMLYDANIISHLMIYVWNKNVNWPDMNTAADNRYFDYVIKRYQAFPNLVWDISKEALVYERCDMEYVLDRIVRLRSLDTFSRLMTVHDYKFCNTYPDHVDFISIQSWAYELYNHMQQVTDAHKNKAILNIEHGGYEKSQYEVYHGNYDDAKVCLKRNYICAFAGVYSTYYWQGSSWNVIISDPFNKHIKDQPKFEYYKHFTNIFNKYNYNNLEPVNSSSSSWVLTDNDSLWLFYAPGECWGINMWGLEKKGFTAKFTWFNILTGEYSDPEEKLWNVGNMVSLPNHDQDWILIIEKVDAETNPTE